MKTSSRKRKKSKFNTGEMLDKLIGMQEKSNKMMMELEMKRVRLEVKQIFMEGQMRREDRELQLQMMNMLTHSSHSMLPPGDPSYSMHSTDGYGGYHCDSRY